MHVCCLLEIFFVILSIVTSSWCIYGGDSASEHPNRASVVLVDPGYGETPQICSGTLISRQFVLTSALCCSKARKRPGPPRFSIFVGSTRTFSDDGRLHFASYEKNILLVGKRQPALFGVCFIKLNYDVNVTRAVYPAVISNNIITERFVTLGYGSAKTGGLHPHSELLYLNQEIVDDIVCEEAYKSYLEKDDNQMEGLWCMQNSTWHLTEADSGAPVFGVNNQVLYGIAMAGLKTAKGSSQGATLVIQIPPLRAEILKLVKKMAPILDTNFNN